MIRQSIYFKFNNQLSSDYGLINCNISSGMQSEPFAANQSIREVEIKGSSRPYFQGIKQQPLEFTITFAYTDAFTSDNLREVARWLYSPNYYSALQFFDGTGEDLNQIYYAMFIDQPELVSSSNRGYINLKVRCSDAYAYSGISATGVYDYTTNPSGTTYTFENLGDVDCQPVIMVEVVSGTSFKITNTSDSGKYIQFTGLTTETITIDNENEIISSSSGLSRYDNMTSTSVFFSVPRGFNYMIIEGNVKVQWKHENKFITG